MSPSPAVRSLAVTAMLVLACLGCSSPFQSIVRRDSAAGLYERASLEYRLDASRLNLPLAITHVEGQLVSYDRTASNPEPGESTGTLKLVYPHPSGRTDLALARVTIESKLPAPTQAPATADRAAAARLAAGGAPIKETWELDISRAELDRIVSKLNTTGYFEKKTKRGAGVRVATTLDGREVAKDWDQSAELDQLMVRVRSQGQLVAMDRPAGYRPQGAPPASVVAWRELSARRLAAEAEPTPGDGRPLGSSLATAVQHGLQEPPIYAPQTQISQAPQVAPPRQY
ncbi:MAG: hypothetical protein KF708_21375 [Pirellulales bacterium]|nr:hypothetical protein [Pirellulales bacterium]